MQSPYMLIVQAMTILTTRRQDIKPSLPCFETNAPSGYMAEVISIRSIKRKKCAWRVRYTRKMNFQYQHINHEQLAVNIMNLQPNNTPIVKKKLEIVTPFHRNRPFVAM